jgi:hypothetical protein
MEKLQLKVSLISQALEWFYSLILTDLPEYTPLNLNFVEFDARHTNYPDNAVVYTTLPP